MFEGIRLITEKEDSQSFIKQLSILKLIQRGEISENILKLAILQIKSLNNDWETAFQILSCFETDDFRYLVIGSYVANYNGIKITDNRFLSKLHDGFDQYTRRQKAIVLYLQSFVEYGAAKEWNKRKLTGIINEAISLDSQCPSFYELRALLMKDKEDEVMADRCRIILSEEELRQREDSLDPEFFIDWYIIHKYDYYLC